MRKALYTLLMVTSIAPMAQAQARAGGEFRVNTYTPGSQGSSAVAADAAGRYVVVWTSVGQDGSAGAIVGQRFDPAGARIGGEFVVNQYTTGAQVVPSVAAAPDGRFMVTWTSAGQDGSGYGIFGRAYRATGEPAGPEFAVNAFTTDDQVAADVAAIPGGFVVVWPSYDRLVPSSQIFGNVYDANGQHVGGEFQVGTSSGAYDYQFGATASGLPNGAYVVAWSETGTFDQHIFYRVYDTGGPLGPQTQADSLSGPDPLEFRRPPDVLVREDGSFTLAWELETCFAGDGIFCSERGVQGRDFDPVGVPVGVEFQVSQPMSAYPLTPDPQLAVSALGMQLGAWSAQEGDICLPPGLCFPDHTSPDGSVSAVVARRFGPVLPGSQFVVNTFTPGAQFSPAVASDAFGNVLITWTSDGQDGSGTGVYAQRFGGLRPLALDVDPAGNHVFDPGENVTVRPTWRNFSGGALTFGGSITDFTGPAFATYTITDALAIYGTVADGAAAPCTDCYSVAVTAPAPRPITHWDASVVEVINPSDLGQRVRWPLHVGRSFGDVDPASPFYRFIETLLHRGVTAGCTSTTYCPGASTTREQMAVFVLVAKEGAGYTPPACSPPNVFDDMPETSPFCRYVEELANRGVVGGCAPGQYCGTSPVTREQMAVFVLRTLDPSLDPPACAPPNVFDDMPESSPFCRWVEELSRRGIVTGCAPGQYCGGSPVTREQMGVFLGATFGLTLYGI